MIIVTGGAGFIGSNIVKHLPAQHVVVVDDLTDGIKFHNIATCPILDYIDKTDFLADIIADKPFKQPITAIIHQGACATTTEWDGRYMMQNNYEYSKILLDYALENKIPFIYASSAAVYGNGQVFQEQLQYEAPINVYAYSKFLFDQYVRRKLPTANSQVVGLRYFNVYGPHEAHKGAMASVIYHFNQQLQQNGEVRLFAGSGGYGDGEQRRDFIYIDDVVAVVRWFLEHPDKSGIFNLGTGRSQSFNEVAAAVLAFHQRGKITYVPFPEHLQGAYQSFTEADLSRLRQIGYQGSFRPVEQGVRDYLSTMK